MRTGDPASPACLTSSMPGSSRSSRSRNPASCDLVGHHHIEAANPRKAPEQVEVSRPQAPWIGWTIGHRHNHMIEGCRVPAQEQPVAQPMLVKGAARGGQALVGEKGQAEERGLVYQRLAAAVGAPLDAKLVEERPDEPPDGALPAAKLIVEVEHGGHQARPYLKRWAADLGTATGRKSRALEQHFALDPREPGRRVGQQIVQARHPVVPCQDVGKDPGLPAKPDGPSFDCLPEQFGRRPSGHENDAAARIERFAGKRALDERLTERGQPACADEMAAGTVGHQGLLRLRRKQAGHQVAAGLREEQQ